MEPQEPPLLVSNAQTQLNSLRVTNNLGICLSEIQLVRNKRAERLSNRRGGYNGYRIPDSRFRQYFGRDHFFRISALPLVSAGGMPRFQYNGYWVTLMDPWPESWGRTGTNPTMCILNKPTMGTTSITARTKTPRLPSLFRFSWAEDCIESALKRLMDGYCSEGLLKQISCREW